jgi:tetratricopeptide (TPR) repeat protein
MVDLVAAFPKPLGQSTLVREQQGFALNRLGRKDEAEAVLKEIIAVRGASSETNGLLGRVYKDRWEAEQKAGNAFAARGWLKKAIATYLQGFESDWRDAYPGINAVTLMELASPPDPRRGELLPVVTYAVKRRLAKGTPDYWDHATLLELAVLSRDQGAAEDAAANALAAVRELWEPETTARNLSLIGAARAASGEQPAWADDIEKALFAKAAGQ